MGIMDPDLRLDLPQVVREYVLARRWWIDVAFDEETSSDAAWGELERAAKALEAELRNQGGSMTCDGVTYTLDPKGRGIEISIEVDGIDRQAAMIKEDLAKARPAPQKKLVLRRCPPSK